MPIDHVELFVPRREEAAEWYRAVLGCEVLQAYRSWASPTGPLMISNDGGATKIALFRGPSQGDEDPRGFRRLAFGVTGPEFVSFLESSGEWRSEPLTAGDVHDHGRALSVYFPDPYGNQLEVTTYQPDSVRDRIG